MLRASDGPAWSLRFGGERIVAEPGEHPPDVTVSGTSSQLYLWVWNRPAAVRVDGDAAVARRWARVCV